jgi:hypothetical protein
MLWWLEQMKALVAKDKHLARASDIRMKML